MFAIPRTIVRKMIGPMTIFTRLMKTSPSGFMALAVSGAMTPRRMPRAMAIKTRTVRLRKTLNGLGIGIGPGPSGPGPGPGPGLGLARARGRAQKFSDNAILDQ